VGKLNNLLIRVLNVCWLYRTKFGSQYLFIFIVRSRSAHWLQMAAMAGGIVPKEGSWEPASNETACPLRV
jgi:hypothetical protein